MPCAIELCGVQVAYDDTVVVPDANLSIAAGKVTMLIGPNGCGKSTTLKAIARINPLRKGEVLLHGESVAGMSQRALARKLAVLPAAACGARGHQRARPGGIRAVSLSQAPGRPFQGGP